MEEVQASEIGEEVECERRRMCLCVRCADGLILCVCCVCVCMRWCIVRPYAAGIGGSR